MLLERGRNRGELVVQLGAHAVYDRNDGERDARCNQAVFDRRRAGFVRKELQKVMLQFRLRWSFTELPSAHVGLRGKI